MLSPSEHTQSVIRGLNGLFIHFSVHSFKEFFFPFESSQFFSSPDTVSPSKSLFFPFYCKFNKTTCLLEHCHLKRKFVSLLQMS